MSAVDKARPVADLVSLRAVAEAATPGPWGWFGNTQSNTLYLATRGRGRQFVMAFCRWGTRAAQPLFRSAPGDYDGIMLKATTLARYEVLGDKTIAEAGKEPYRYDVSSIGNQDAEFIAAFSPDVVLQLLDEIESLRRERI